MVLFVESGFAYSVSDDIGNYAELSIIVHSSEWLGRASAPRETRASELAARMRAKSGSRSAARRPSQGSHPSPLVTSSVQVRPGRDAGPHLSNSMQLSLHHP